MKEYAKHSTNPMEKEEAESIMTIHFRKEKLEIY